ncbi:MAG TPA: tRNA (adenosine(37)-N6)-dimethylallyltransferase MiaA [Desulfuromonadales bacterium]|nr:tRNA (adenosine(37)-N6)-dimethylallyltransferase MiaA [Desulfuromonadales bacterium]
MENCEKKHPDSRPPLAVVCGPTASGKTALALQMAEHLDIEIISADSRQVYRGMDIGTAKASAEEQALVPHHLIDVVGPDQSFTVADFVGRARRADREIRQRGRLPVVVGGTGLYIQAFVAGLADLPPADPSIRQRLNEYAERHGDAALHAWLCERDPEQAARIHPRNRVRVVRALEVFELSGMPMSQWQREHAFAERPFRVTSIGLSPPREELFARIDRRVDAMMEEGLEDEVRRLLARGCSVDLKAMKTLGYREMIHHIQGRISQMEAVELIKRDTRRYARRQLTWFRRNETINWFESSAEFAKLKSLIEI